MILALVLTLVGCSGSKDDTATATGDAAAGATVYANLCVSCHGADGTQGTPVNGTASADLTFEVPDNDDASLHDTIANGYGDMPAMTQDETEIADCIAYLRETFPG